MSLRLSSFLLLILTLLLFPFVNKCLIIRFQNMLHVLSIVLTAIRLLNDTLYEYLAYLI